MSELHKIKPPVQREIRTTQEARSFMSRFTCPPEVRELAISLWEVRHRENRGVITRDEALLAERVLTRNAKADSDRRFKADAYARLIAMDNAIVTENRAEEDDPEADPESEDELQGFDLSCPSCGYDSEDSPMSYADDRQAIDIRCARCGRSYSVNAMDQSEVSSLRKIASERQYEQVQRSRLPECLRGKKR